MATKPTPASSKGAAPGAELLYNVETLLMLLTQEPRLLTLLWGDLYPLRVEILLDKLDDDYPSVSTRQKQQLLRAVLREYERASQASTQQSADSCQGVSSSSVPAQAKGNRRS